MCIRDSSYPYSYSIARNQHTNAPPSNPDTDIQTQSRSHANEAGGHPHTYKDAYRARYFAATMS